MPMGSRVGTPWGHHGDSNGIQHGDTKEMLWGQQRDEQYGDSNGIQCGDTKGMSGGQLEMVESWGHMGTTGDGWGQLGMVESWGHVGTM